MGKGTGSRAGDLGARRGPLRPVLVESDLEGNSLFERENAKIAGNIAKLYEGTKPPTLSRFGETDDKTEELI